MSETSVSKERHKTSTADFPAASSYPLTLKNAGQEITFKKPPERVITLMQQDAEVLVALGLKDKLVGYALVTEETPARYKRELAGIRILATNTPSKENIFQVNPDFIISSEQSFISNTLGSRQKLNQLGVNTYVTKNKHPATLDNQVYQQIRDMAHIFNVEKKGQKVIDSIQQEINCIKAQIGEIKDSVKVAYLAGGKGGTVQVAGANSLDSYLMNLAGGKNVFKELKGYLVQVSWEEIVARNPDVIVISYCCGTGPEDLRHVLKNKTALQEVSAIKHHRLVPVQVEETTGSMRIPIGFKKLAQGFYPERFQ